MTPVVCICCGERIGPAFGDLRGNPNLCAACDWARELDTRLFRRLTEQTTDTPAMTLPGPGFEKARLRRN